MKTCHFHRCWAEIDLDALSHNWELISQLLPPHVKPMAVVKANAYGLGAVPIVEKLKTLPQVHGFCVANVEEGSEVRSVETEKPILVLGSPFEHEYPALFENDLTTIVSSADEVRLLAEYAQRYEKILKVHIKVDTGLGRMGVWYERAKDLYLLIQKIHFLQLTGIGTHFAASGNNPDFTRLQRLRFIDTITSFPHANLQKLCIHCDNSAGLASFENNGIFNSSRIGLLQYGIIPTDWNLPSLNALPLKPVFSLHTRLSLIKELPAGESISYGRLYFLKKPTRIGIMAAGYADGIALPMTNKGIVLIQGHRCPTIGRIAMDQVVIDLSEVPSARVGDPVTLVGKQNDSEITLQEFSQNANSIPWQCICSLGRRVTHLYLDQKKESLIGRKMLV
ncbi:MAG: alanine racemase [Verrucomicrobia bacterium GWC2_42_7]|nr:MAG: alanine racemase [Verrucomicrobia bacterium GWC2_42_7]